MEVLSILVVLAVVVGVFLICRAIVLWYWKIDQIVTLLQKIESHLSNDKKTT